MVTAGAHAFRWLLFFLETALNLFCAASWPIDFYASAKHRLVSYFVLLVVNIFSAVFEALFCCLTLGFIR